MEPNQTNEVEQKSNGALVGSIIIIIILVIGGIYFWKSSVREQMMPLSSDSSTSMEANLNSIDMENLDQAI